MAECVCGAELERPHPDAQWECPECGRIVSNEAYRDPE